MSVPPSTWKNLVVAGWIFVKFYVVVVVGRGRVRWYLIKSVDKIQLWSKSERQFVWRPACFMTTVITNVAIFAVDSNW
jgi:hypothetical protein